jgi:hypothetical protein
VGRPECSRTFEVFAVAGLKKDPVGAVVVLDQMWPSTLR